MPTLATSPAALLKAGLNPKAADAWFNDLPMADRRRLLGKIQAIVGGLSPQLKELVLNQADRLQATSLGPASSPIVPVAALGAVPAGTTPAQGFSWGNLFGGLAQSAVGIVGGLFGAKEQGKIQKEMVEMQGKYQKEIAQLQIEANSKLTMDMATLQKEAAEALGKVNLEILRIKGQQQQAAMQQYLPWVGIGTAVLGGLALFMILGKSKGKST